MFPTDPATPGILCQFKVSSNFSTWRAVTGRRAERWRAGGGGSLPAAPGSAALAPTVVRCGRESLRRGVRSTFGLVTGLYFYESASPIRPMGLSSGPYSVFYFIIVGTVLS